MGENEEEKTLQEWTKQKYGHVLEGAIYMKKEKYFHIILPKSSAVATCRKVAKEKDKMIRSRHVSQRSNKSINMWNRTLPYCAILYSSLLYFSILDPLYSLYLTILCSTLLTLLYSTLLSLLYSTLLYSLYLTLPSGSLLEKFFFLGLCP